MTNLIIFTGMFLIALLVIIVGVIVNNQLEELQERVQLEQIVDYINNEAIIRDKKCQVFKANSHISRETNTNKNIIIIDLL
jgi:hypothetical protein